MSGSKKVKKPSSPGTRVSRLLIYEKKRNYCTLLQINFFIGCSVYGGKAHHMVQNGVRLNCCLFPTYLPPSTISDRVSTTARYHQLN